MSDYNKEIAKEVVDCVKNAGYRAFLAKSRDYGFFTDTEGSRIISFGVDLGTVKLSGNYSTNQPKQTGTGWRICEGFDCSKINEYFNTLPPRWAVGSSDWKLTDLENHLRVYQQSSQFTEE
jgi:hypothetical protein